jgi:opine dehydrogenase
MDINKVSILGCGNGGMALAADLKLKGVEVALWADSNHATKLQSISQSNNKVILHEGPLTQTAQLDLVTEDLSAAVTFGSLIYVCTPMDAHVDLFQQIAALLKHSSDKKMVINLSGVFSGVDLYLKVDDKTVFRTLTVFDSSTFPYACRAGEDNQVTVYGRKRVLPLASLFSRDQHLLDHIQDKVKPIPFLAVEDVFKLGLMGNNAVLHPATALCNIQAINQAQAFKFYKEGNSQRTATLHEAVDKERLLLAETMGYTLKTNVAMLNQL